MAGLDELEAVSTNLHVGGYGARKGLVALLSRKWRHNEAAPIVTEQPFLGMHCSPHHGEGARKGALKKAHFILTLTG